MQYRRLSYHYTGIVSGMRCSLPGHIWSGYLPSGFAHRQWQPPADLYETATDTILKVEIAGMADEDFEIALYENVLIIEGVRAWDMPGGDIQYHAVDIHYGAFRLEVPLDRQKVDRDRVQARYDRGLLYVILPKAEVQS